MEQQLPARVFAAEWVALGRGENPEKYKPFARTEETTPLVFAGFHILFFSVGAYLLIVLRWLHTSTPNPVVSQELLQ